METKRVRKAVIPAAGLGTRFLPATKSVPKELLPIVDTPTLQMIVQEIVDSGIETVILITGKGKTALEDHFDLSLELERKLESEGKFDLADKLKKASSLARFVTVRQSQPRGLGDAVLCAREVVGNEPFVVLLGDDLVDAKVPCTKQMIDVYNKHGRSVVALMEIERELVSRFGICAGKSVSNDLLELSEMVEKPNVNEAPSNLAIVGRYILNPRIFELLASQTAGRAGEIQLTDAMARLMREEGFYGYKFQGQRFDAGDKFGFLQANIHWGLKNPEIAPKLIKYMQQLLTKGQS